MSAPKGGGRAGGACRGQRPSAAPGALATDAVAAGSALSRAGGGAARLAAAAPTPGAAEQRPATAPPSAPPGSADTPRAGLAALSLHTPGPGDSAAAGCAATATRPSPPPAATIHGAGGASSSPGAGASAASDGCVARGAGVPGHGPAAAAALPTPAGDTSVPDAKPPVAVGDDGLPLSAEAAASPFSPPASERHAAFLKMLEHAIKAGLQKRHVREADFSAHAAEAGVPLFGKDSLIVANLRVNQALALSNQAVDEPDPAEKEALWRQARAVLLAQALPVLQSRVDKGSLLPGRLRKVEEAYDVYEMQSYCRLTERSVPGAATLQGRSRLMGYDMALRATSATLNLLRLHPLWRTDERGRAQAFVLNALRLIPKTVGVPYQAASELQLVDDIERYMTPVLYGADFCASVLAVWRSREVADVLRLRRSKSSATIVEIEAEIDARKQADLAKRGLRRCALPSCGKQEATVLQFRVCGHCQTTRYCCPEHAKQHWKAHKREYEAEGEKSGEGGGGGGASA